ncbi:MAG: GNAT family N-acetyltransferase [Lachnospiraceae bacterium]|jgi:ribosomal protein S18 acetylase RimI-like enzyme|nr:GNAT family N-acetyltransferase [Lachnospiraceae bacterium]
MENREHIKLIEEISLNAWPSHKIELYDGWLIRFSHNYTHRTNSVEQVGVSGIPVEEKIHYCEQMYANYHTPTHFKISPLLDPDFDALLASKGYETQHETVVMTMPMTDYRRLEPTYVEYEYYERNSGLPSSVFYEGGAVVQMRDRIYDEWIASVFRFNGTTNPTLLRIVPSMFRAIPKETLVAYIEGDTGILGLGLGILDRGHIGLYAINVHPNFRRKGYARAICHAILGEAAKKGAHHAYLQVVKENHKAKELYRSLGMADDYTCSFRSKVVNK